MDEDTETSSLTDEDAKRRFVGDALRARREWDPDDPQANFDALTGAASERLADAGVDDTTYQMSDQMASGHASTSTGYHTAASITLPEADFQKDDLDPDLVDTVYHESVHAEQRRIADQVKDNDIENPTERENAIYDNVYGENRGFDQLIQRTLPKEQGDEPGYDLRYDAYRDQAMEQEAWETGQSVAEMFAEGARIQDERAARREELANTDPLEGGLTLFDEPAEEEQQAEEEAEES
jgi:hypothetical protein